MSKNAKMFKFSFDQGDGIESPAVWSGPAPERNTLVLPSWFHEHSISFHGVTLSRSCIVTKVDEGKGIIYIQLATDKDIMRFLR